MLSLNSDVVSSYNNGSEERIRSLIIGMEIFRLKCDLKKVNALI